MNPARRWLLAAALVAASIPATARQRMPAGVGSAIGLRYSIQHEALQPGEDTTLLLCLANENPRSGREVAAGDSFAFTFRDGVLHACDDLTVFSPDGSLSPADFACEIDGDVVSLTYQGARPAAWPFGDAACVLVGYQAGAASSTVTASLDATNQGAFLAPAPPILVVSVAPNLGNVGPPGPQGPAGPAGTSGIGAWRFATSTDSACTWQNGPPEPIPGLDVTIDVRAGSSLEIHGDGMAHNVPFWGGGTSHVMDRTSLSLELDGTVVASRHLSDSNPSDVQGSPLTIHWASGPLAAGSHQVRLLVDDQPTESGSGSQRTGCIGSADNDGYQARLLVKELVAGP